MLNIYDIVSILNKMFIEDGLVNKLGLSRKCHFYAIIREHSYSYLKRCYARVDVQLTIVLT